jgi:hypothetical protein
MPRFEHVHQIRPRDVCDPRHNHHPTGLLRCVVRSRLFRGRNLQIVFAIVLILIVGMMLISG